LAIALLCFCLGKAADRGNNQNGKQQNSFHVHELSYLFEKKASIQQFIP
jgi:hypothetical protein